MLSGQWSVCSLRSTIALVVSALATLAFVPAPAQARVVEVGGTKFGVQRHSAPASLFENEELEPQTFANGNGSPVLHQNSTYAIFWDPDYRYLDPWVEVIDQFFQNMGTASGSLESVFAVDTQYTDKTNKPAVYRSAFHGSYADKAPYPSPEGCEDPNPLGEGDAIGCLSDRQIREQLESFISREGLPKGMGTIYYLLTPPGVTVCTDEGVGASHCSSNSGSASSFCSYHAAITPTNPTTGDGNTILYGVIPWTAGGFGDPLLGPSSRTPAYDCQDGGFDPSSKPGEKKEKPKEKSEKQKEEEKAKEKERTKEENEKAKIAEELEGPHEQEPNQTECPNVYDGGCDIGLADIIINQIASEQQDIITDPLLNAWQDKKHNEVVDECRNIFGLVTGGAVTAKEESGAGTLYNQTLGSGNYYLNDAFNAAALRLYQPGDGCLNHVNLAPSFTAPTPVNSGEIVGLNGLESNVALNAAAYFPGGVEKSTYATYSWNFGDGSSEVSGFAPGAPPCSETPWRSPCAASVFHSYKYGGTYEVTLTVRDVGGNEVSVSHQITVDGPPPPAPPPSPSPTPGGSGSPATPGVSSGPGSPSVNGAAANRPTLPAPVANQAVQGGSLAKTTRSGLVVRYSVNEQVTGRFEVLLAAAIAHRLGLRLPLATGLPAGTPPQVAVGKALLITTKGGRGTLKIQFGRVTGARLRRLHRVALMLRLNLRNASGGTTTVLSKIALSR
jgi:PKD domain